MLNKQGKYEAGWSTAGVDRERGMSLASMDKVANVPSDNSDWAHGYRDRLASYRASDTGTDEPKKVMSHTKEIKIVNMEAMPRGLGARYLEVIEGLAGEWVAKQWRRKPVAGVILVAIAFGLLTKGITEIALESGIKFLQLQGN